LRTLVTGATGSVGSRIVPRLAARGDLVRVLVHDPERAAPLWNAGCDVVIGDLSDPAAVRRAVADMDAVVHLVDTGQEATVRLAEAARDAGVRRFVDASADLPALGGDVVEVLLGVLSGSV
jgi:uncharacterized protein YbjT (DUF2867 family)